MIFTEWVLIEQDWMLLSLHFILQVFLLLVSFVCLVNEAFILQIHIEQYLSLIVFQNVRILTTS